MEDKKKQEFISLDAKIGSQDLDAFVLDPALSEDRIKYTFVAGGQAGGKIASEFCRLGYPLIAYNTSKEDLKDLQDRVDQMDDSIKGTFKSIYLEGEGGSSKDMDLGYQAVVDNARVLEEALVGNEDITDADFIWLVIGAGGGTGMGSFSLVANYIAQIRSQASKLTYRAGQNKVPVGAIIALPDFDTCGTEVAVNVAKLISDISIMHSELNLGAVLLIDNKKIAEDFSRDYAGKFTNKTWAIDGNIKVGRILTEMALFTGLPSDETYDKSEFIEILSEPGYLNVAKKPLYKDWLNEYLEDESERANFDALSDEKRKAVYEKVLNDAFKDNIFVKSLDFDDATIGGLMLMTDGKIINTKDSIVIKSVMVTDIMNGKAADKNHYGFVRNTDYKGTLSSMRKKAATEGGSVKEEEVPGACIYAQCVTATPPQYIYTWIEDTKEKHAQSEAKKLELLEKRAKLTSMLGDVSSASRTRLGERKDDSSGLMGMLNSGRGVKKSETTSKGISFADLVKKSSAEGTNSSKKEKVNYFDEQLKLRQ